MKLFLVLSMAAMAAVSLSGCTPVGLVVGGAAAAGVVVAEERSISDAVEDAGIKINIMNGLFKKSETLFVDVSTIVIEGRVLVTGVVRDVDHRDAVAAIIWKTDGVEEVLNELQISNQSNIPSSAEDSWVSAKLKARLLQDISIKHVNYSMDTVNRVVYLMGIAQNPAELERVYLHARDVDGVRKIISHVVMKDSRDAN
ncbi:MAG: BON domain-containing protein [Sneathiella sp.]|nr:BON domain-containing protein [Sneathiella sp.]